MAGVEHLHDPEVLLTELHGDVEEGGHVKIDVGHGGEQRFFDEGAD